MKVKVLSVLFAVVLFAVVFSGCNESNQSNEKSKFIGTWKYTRQEEDYRLRENTFTFYNNDSVKGVDDYLYDNLNGTITWGYYQIKDGQLCITYTDEFNETYSDCQDYEFSNDNTALILKSDEGETVTFNKIE